MNGDMRRPFARKLFCALAALFALCGASLAQGFGNLGAEAPGFDVPRPGTPIVFPKDHGAHTSFRTEWWYLTANLKGEDGAAYGAQWTLFRHALEPRSGEGWDDRTAFMAHAAITSAKEHLFAQTIARGGVGQAGVEAAPFRAFVDDWGFEATDKDFTRARVFARDEHFFYALELARDAPFVLQGDRGFSRKSEAGQASHYYSQPFFRVSGTISIHGRETKVTGRAWMDREWSSQPLSADQKGWDWFSLHLAGGEKLMLFRLRGARDYFSGNWIAPDGPTTLLTSDDIAFEPLERTLVAGHSLPTRWRVKVKSRAFDVETRPLNPRSWMGTNFPYWEGPVTFSGSHSGEGYLEMTGYGGE
jgi:predicted secreted hydrolase